METNLLKLIHDTKAVSIWNRKAGPVFWYAASVPGPFYVNTELVIGPKTAEDLLQKITDIIATTEEPRDRAVKLDDAIMTAYKNSAQYKQVIAAMVTKAKSEFPEGSYTLISGGERRDWLFSIPFAHENGKAHAYLFKNHSLYCERPLQKGEKTLHVADLINNAASYFDMWFPILKKAQLACVGTVCINSRGSNGLKRLKDAGQKAVILNSIDLDFFKLWLESGLIDRETYDELAVYFDSPQKWASRYLIGHSDLFDVKTKDKKTFERLQSFFTSDPWSLRKDHEAFFATMQKEIAAR